jgi:hypothetical protein
MATYLRHTLLDARLTYLCILGSLTTSICVLASLVNNSSVFVRWQKHLLCVPSPGNSLKLIQDKGVFACNRTRAGVETELMAGIM